ncbi:4-galactosyl-N-acetylglucosaminide 3-alpha-L-fucosyltransferase 9-like [Crassostrea angulata]|uniref:4-galactosyl-N-acetylglucosaminide 3-alpha-L-fucosyltransferase 9-like n=1 Tax=Magallana angulata TaxID=2784310 RepID=UPI0022B12D26|nr:4-galactosyl-N-acetylglucosaminide 3-alpha-L-fucosyltransferase 9-like [Crassostrea angulata]
MKAINMAFFCIISVVGVFILGYFVSSEETIHLYVHPLIKKITANETQTPASVGEIYSFENKSLIILWYNIPFYLKSSAKHFRSSKCSNLGSICILSTNSSDLGKSSAVVFTHFNLPKTPPMKIASQIWIFNSMENKAFTQRPSSVWDNQFEWTMSYRRDADISRPYGKIKSLERRIVKNYSEVFRQKTKFGVWMSGHCPVPSRRKEYIEKLQKYIDIDTFGPCGKKKCGVRTPAMNECLKNFSRDYKFYFSLENNICTDYSTEKVFNLYEYNMSIIPVVNGPPQASDYLPTGTFINALDYSSPETLAKKLKEIGSNEKIYSQYLKEKDKYTSLNTFQIFQEAMCTACIKLDKLNGKKIPAKRKVIDMFKNNC